jgi:hypothetical protein
VPPALVIPLISSRPNCRKSVGLRWPKSDKYPSGRAGTLVQPVNGAARLVIRRIPDLGKTVAVNLSIDGVPVAIILYGHTYEGFLSPGRHVLSVFPTPNPKYPNPWKMTLDARSGHTYTFTADGDSGHLILQAPGGPERPRGR